MTMRVRQGGNPSRRRAVVRAGRLALALVLLGCALGGTGAGTALAASMLRNTIPPEVAGETRIGARLVCGAGSWSGIVNSFQYRWIRAGAKVATGLTYTLGAADEGKEVWCVVTASNGTESAEAESANSVTLPGKEKKEEPHPTPPEAKAPFPQVSGEPRVGATLTCSSGTWTGTPPPELSYRWLRDKETIAGVATSAYIATAEDAGHSLSCKVIARNVAGEAFRESENSIRVPAEPPSNQTLPEVVGNPSRGQAITCNPGTWNGSPPIKYSYQWLRDGLAIAGAIAQTYEVAGADEGQLLACRVVAKNSVASAEAVSPAVRVAEQRVENEQQPAITPSAPKTGTQLSCSEGKWKGSPTEFDYEWLRDGSEPLEDHSSKYEVVAADLGHALYCQVTAKNASTQESVLSPPVVVPEPAVKAPENQGRPEISGSGGLGQTLNCSSGTWSNSPTEFVYQWLRDKTQSIPTGTTSSYKVQEADEGHSLSCRVTAINRGGSAKAESEGLRINGSQPTNVGPPEILGQLRVGETLTCARGEWRGVPKPEYRFTWRREGTAVQTTSGYTLTNADRGRSLTCEVTAENGEGSPVTAASAPVRVPGVPPEAAEPPVVTGEPDVGQTLTCSSAPGQWSGAPAPELSYQWLVNGQEIEGATTRTLTVSPLYRGLDLSCRVTGRNAEGSSSSTSRSVHVPGTKPEVIEAPSVSGTPAVGQLLTCERGIWNGKPPPSFEYSWLRDGSVIEGQTGNTYLVEPGDQGHLLTCSVTARNGEGQLEAESANGATIPRRLTSTTTPANPGGGAPPHTAAIILAAIKRQLASAMRGLHLSKLLKAGGLIFTFAPPSLGHLEVTWMESSVAVHGAKKGKPVLVARSSVLFTQLKKTKVKVGLTWAGRKRLTGRSRVTLALKVHFTTSQNVRLSLGGTLTIGR